MNIFSLVIYKKEPSGQFSFCEAFQDADYLCQQVFNRTSAYWDVSGRNHFRLDLLDDNDQVVASKELQPSTNPCLDFSAQFY